VHVLAIVVRQAFSSAGGFDAQARRAAGLQASYVSWAVRMQACAVASHAAMQADRVSADALPMARSVATKKVISMEPRM